MIAVLCIHQLVCCFMHSDMVCRLSADFSTISILFLRPIVCTAPSDPALYTCLTFAKPVPRECGVFGRKSLSPHLVWMRVFRPCSHVMFVYKHERVRVVRSYNIATRMIAVVCFFVILFNFN